MGFTNPLKKIIIAVESLDRASANLAVITTQLTALQASADRTTAQLAATSVALDKVGASAARAGPPVASFNKGLIGAAAVARGMFIRIIVLSAAIAVLGVATRGTAGAAIDFENSFTKIRKTVDLTEEGFKKLAQANRDLAKEIPVNVNELNEIGEIAGQLGIQGVKNIVRFEEAIAKVAVATDLTTQEAAINFAQLAAIFSLNVEQIEFLTNVAVSLGNQFETFESKIVSFGLRIGGVGAALGLTASQVLAIGTAFTAVGVPVQRGGTAVQRVLLALNKAANQGGEELEVFLAVLQLTEQQFRDLVKQDPAEAFIRFVEALRLSGDDAIRVLDALGLSDARLVASFFAVAAAGGKLRETFDEAAEAEDNLIAVTTEFDRAADTTSKKAELMRNKFNDIGISIGNFLKPGLDGLIVLLGQLASSILSVSESFGIFKILALQAFDGFTVFFREVDGSMQRFEEDWIKIFSLLPRPVQTMVIDVLRVWDLWLSGMIFGVNGLIKAFNVIPLAMNSLILGPIKAISIQIGAIFDKLINGIISGANIAAKIGNKLTPFFDPFGTIDFQSRIEQSIGQIASTIGDIPFVPEITFTSNIADLIAEVKLTLDRARLDKKIADFLAGKEAILAEAAFVAPGIPGLDEFLDALEASADKAGTAAKKAATELDPLADGIITLFEALKFGVAGAIIPLLELQFAAKEQASAIFRTNVEISKLSILMAGQGGLADTAGVLRFSLTTLGESFKKANETVLGFFNRLAQAALDATNDAISKLFSRPTRETATLNKALAELEKERLFLLQGGAIPQEQPELFEAIDLQIAVIKNQIRIREAESNILQAQLDLADQTLLTDLELQVAAAVLVTQLEEVSKVADTLARLFFNETIARQFAIDQIGRFTDALAGATAFLVNQTSPGFAHGGIGNFGAGTLVSLHGREAILPLEDPRRMAEILSRVGLQSGAGGGAVVQVNTIVDPDITNLRRIIVKEVAEKTDQALRQAGFGGEFVTSGAFAPG